MNLPHKLVPGDTIGVISTSAPVEREKMEYLKSYFNQRGYRVKFSKHCLNNFGFLAAEPDLMAQDFNEMVADSDVKIIMTAFGGTGAIHLLPLIDYELFKKNPKIFCGLSDPSVLMSTITLKTRVPTFHGPNGYNFGYTNPTNFTEDNWWQMVTGKIELPYDYPVDMKVIRGGKMVTGTLYGGTQIRLNSLIGTKWLPLEKGIILFFESGNFVPVALDDFLANLRIQGVFDLISGLIIGRDCDSSYNKWYGEDAESMEDIILRNCRGYDFPIVNDLLIGHTEDKVTLPIGAQFRLDTENRKLTLLEPVVK